MEVEDSKNLDHHGVIAATISDLNIQKLVSDQLLSSDNCKVGDGDVVAAMIMNGLGFTNKPLSLTPQFFENKALDLLFGEGVKAGDFNRHRLGRCLDRIYDYGCEAFFSVIAQTVCKQEKISETCQSLDTTSFAVSGEYDVDTDEHTISITHGFSKNHRSDLRQVILELLVSQDGGVPLASKSFDGNESDSTIFKERCENLVESFKKGDVPKYLIADSKLYSQQNAENLKSIPFITRIPRVIKEEKAAVSEAQSKNEWMKLDNENKYYLYRCTHYGMEQRWIVVHSTSAQSRAEKTLKKQIKKERQQLEGALKKLKSRKFHCEEDASVAIKKLNGRLNFHSISSIDIKKDPHYTGKGRPKAGEVPVSYTYTPEASIKEDEDKQEKIIEEKSCYVIGSNVKAGLLSEEEIIAAYKNQNNAIERGFRFLKDPYFFSSSLFIKNPKRIMAMLTIMTLSLLVYSIAQRRVRGALKEANDTLPNQINQATQKPTLRWIFQMLEGIHVVYIRSQDKITKVLTGINNLKRKILRFFSERTQEIYGVLENPKTDAEACSM